MAKYRLNIKKTFMHIKYIDNTKLYNIKTKKRKYSQILIRK